MTTFQPAGTRFFAPRAPVEILSMGSDAEATMLRAVLESLNAVVLMHHPGTPGDILTVLDRPRSEPSLLILSGHGDDDGFIIQEVAEGIGVDLSMLVRPDRLPPQALAGRVHLPGWTVLSTGCVTGSPAMVDVFRNAGVAAYIAPDDYPDGSDAVLFTIHVFHALIVRKASVEDAWRRAASYGGDSRMFQLHTPSLSLRVDDTGSVDRIGG